MARIRTKVGFKGNQRDIDVELPEGEPTPWGADARLAVVGTDVPRIDGADKVTGRAKYTFDQNPPGLLWAKILHAPYGAATIKSLDTRRAKLVPGVKAIHVIKDKGRPILHHGDEILAVAATSEEAAEEALHAVDITYEMKPVVTTLDGALRPGAPQVFPGESNLKSGAVTGKRTEADATGEGPAKSSKDKDLDAIFAAGHRLVEGLYETQTKTHSSLETHGVVVRYEKDGSLSVWASTQSTFGVKGGAVEASGLPDAKVNVFTDFVGGGFGSKFTLAPSGLAALALAKATKSPVKLMLTREGEHTTGGCRPCSRQKMRAAVRKDGKVMGLAVETWGSAGVAEGGAGAANPVIYHLGTTSKREHHVFTNASPGAAFRAPGYPQGVFALESFLDDVAAAMGMDPLELRRKNIDHPVYPAQWDMGAGLIGWKEKRKRPRALGPRQRGVGMASGTWFQGGSGGYEVEIVIGKDGNVEVRNGAQDIGTGTKTLLAVVVAEELGLPPARVKVRMGDTRLPKGPGSGGSNTGPSLGPSARNAAVNAKRRLLSDFAAKRGLAPESLTLTAGEVRDAAGKAVGSFTDVCAALTDTLVVRGKRGKSYEQMVKTVAGCQFAEVEVDIETGETRVLKIIAIQDAGRVMNKLLFESQIVGGVVQGLSYALHEERLLDPNVGTQINADFINYKVAGSVDMPEIVPIAFDLPNAGNSCGMMGLGEPPIVPTAAAIANAVFHATGVRIPSLPITPAKILTALADKRGGRAI